MGLLYLYSSLTDIKFSSINKISVQDFYKLLDLNCTKDDKDQISSLRRKIDVKNILSIYSGVSFDPKGNFIESGLRVALSNLEYLPDYVFDFLEEHPDDEELKKHFPKLYADFFANEIARGSLCSEFLLFEKHLNLLLFGLNCKKKNIKIESFLQYEDLSDPVVEYVLLQSKNSGPFIFPYEYKDLEKKINDAGVDPMNQYNAIASYKFDYYKAIVDDNKKLLRSICAYMMCLWIIEEKTSLNEKVGREVLKELVESEDE